MQKLPETAEGAFKGKFDPVDVLVSDKDVTRFEVTSNNSSTWQRPAEARGDGDQRWNGTYILAVAKHLFSKHHARIVAGHADVKPRDFTVGQTDADFVDFVALARAVPATAPRRRHRLKQSCGKHAKDICSSRLNALNVRYINISTPQLLEIPLRRCFISGPISRTLSRWPKSINWQSLVPLDIILQLLSRLINGSKNDGEL